MYILNIFDILLFFQHYFYSNNFWHILNSENVLNILFYIKSSKYSGDILLNIMYSKYFLYYFYTEYSKYLIF